MSMFRIGEHVLSTEYPEYGVGIIVAQSSPFDLNGYTVRWGGCDLTLWENEASLVPARMKPYDARILNLNIQRELLEKQYAELLAMDVLPDDEQWMLEIIEQSLTDLDRQSDELERGS